MPSGVYPRTEKHIKICSKAGKASPTKFKKGHKVPEEWRQSWAEKNKDKPRSKETRKKISESIKGEKNHFYGKHHTKETKEKISKIHKGKKLSKELIRKCLRRRNKSSLESKFEDIIVKLNLPYNFVGNAGFFIGRKVPDFIHNNEKIAIEVYCRKHKEMFRNGLKIWKKERKEYFNKYGYKIIFFDETQINEKNIKMTLSQGG